ncbi:hypothetical protein CWB99_21550 [Pseudoalteromonas rubra]|uniref:Uncharacterized protein n=1 Tax=Pseudoalteromonas rubra TaxID=43658 RepID=A0A5S3WFP4_9GAMM|nr:hypothetical protein [Pseudoalteromonas rubra]TMP24668.1 hypothetical protein CWB99_21550 [Pseudoalteromonas rubra]TMP26903.1 hypothetical protein CWC00_23750 [Pseudoalteromonas rubra]
MKVLSALLLFAYFSFNCRLLFASETGSSDNFLYESHPMVSFDGGCIGSKFEQIRGKARFTRELFPLTSCGGKHSKAIVSFDSSVKESEIKFVVSLLVELGVLSNSYGYDSNDFKFKFLEHIENIRDFMGLKAEQISVSIYERWEAKKIISIQYHDGSKFILTKVLTNGLNIESVSSNRLMMN